MIKLASFILLISTTAHATSVPVRVQVYNGGIGYQKTEQALQDYVRDNNVQVVREGNTISYSY